MTDPKLQTSRYIVVDAISHLATDAVLAILVYIASIDNEPEYPFGSMVIQL